MITSLLIFKEKLKMIYAKAGVVIKAVLNFALAFLSTFVVSRAIGNGSMISSPLICIAIALVCAFMPINVTVVVVTVYIVAHLFGISLELAIIALAVLLIIYLLYFRLAPKTGILLILTPLLFYLKIPYLVPVVAALTVGMTGIVPVVSGAFIYYLVDFAHRYTTAITTLDAENALQNITFIFNNILTNKELIVVAASFSVVITIIYLIKRLSVDHSWIIAIIAGCVIDALIQIIAFSVLSVQYNIVFMLIGHIIAIGIGMLLHLLLFSVDYSATEYVQFEDDDYYYYVKAVPKSSVTNRKVTVKKINSRQDGKGFVHTERYDDDGEEELEEI